MESSDFMISIITPVYNSALTIDRVYQSVCSQRVPNLEWITVDDNSSDDSFDRLLIISKSDSRVRVLKNKRNKGAGGARNTGILQASSNLITFIDADDEWDSNFLETMIEYVRRPGSAAFSGYRRKTGNLITNFVPTKIITSNELFSGCDISCLTGIYHFKSKSDIPYFGEIAARNDLVFNIRALKNIKFALPVPEVLATYHLREGSLSSSKIRMIYWQFYVSRMFGRSLVTSLIDLAKWSIYGLVKYSGLYRSKL